MALLSSYVQTTWQLADVDAPAGILTLITNGTASQIQFRHQHATTVAVVGYIHHTVGEVSSGHLDVAAGAVSVLKKLTYMALQSS